MRWEHFWLIGYTVAIMIGGVTHHNFPSFNLLDGNFLDRRCNTHVILLGLNSLDGSFSGS
jgi:hypothetical protein